MKLLLSIFFLSLSVFSFGQSKIDFSGSLNYSDTHILDTEFTSLYIGKFNYQVGLNYSHPLQEKLWLKIGLGFSSMGYKTENINLQFPDQVEETGLLTGGLPPSVESVQFKYNFHSLEIPLALRYEFSKKKLKPFVELGISMQYYLQSVGKLFFNGEERLKEKEREKAVNQIQFAPTVAFGFSYAFNEKWELLVQPNFRYHLTKNVDAPVPEHLWSAGLALGVRVTIR